MHPVHLLFASTAIGAKSVSHSKMAATGIGPWGTGSAQAVAMVLVGPGRSVNTQGLLVLVFLIPSMIRPEKELDLGP